MFTLNYLLDIKKIGIYKNLMSQILLKTSLIWLDVIIWILSILIATCDYFFLQYRDKWSPRACLITGQNWNLNCFES